MAPRFDIRSARFLRSATKAEDASPDDLPQVAVAGRSNVGKSSLINTLTRQRGLARTSRTPGRTREIVLFRVNDAFTLADLPGYGFAKVAKSVRAEWGRVIERYLEATPTLRAVLVIFDARRDLRPDDAELLHWLAHLGRPTICAITKLDKFGRNRSQGELARWRRALDGLVSAPPVGFSSTTGQGRPELVALLGEAIEGRLEPVSPERFTRQEIAG